MSRQPPRGIDRREIPDRRAVARGGRRAGDESALRDVLTRLLKSTGVPPSILIVDDFPDGLAMSAEFFRHIGFRVTEAASGTEALAQALACAPDVVLLDVVLPDMDGFEVLARLRTSERTERAAVALCTAALTSEIRERATRAGVDLFFPKPCDLPVLALQIAHFVDQRMAPTTSQRGKSI